MPRRSPTSALKRIAASRALMNTPFGYTNAMSRAVAASLTDMGIRVTFVYPEEEVAIR